MNNLAFLQKLIEAYKTKVEMFSTEGNVSIKFNGQQWDGVTLDQCVNKVKESLAIQRLEQIERQ